MATLRMKIKQPEFHLVLNLDEAKLLAYACKGHEDKPELFEIMNSLLRDISTWSSKTF